MSNQPSGIVKAPDKADLDAVAGFYGVPSPVAKMMFAMIQDTLYPKLQFLLYKGHQKGIQRIELSEPKEINNEWTTEARIHPFIAPSILSGILHLPADERKAIWDHYSKPTIEWGRASKENVSNQTMWKWLPEMSRKRATARALRLFAGIGATAYEEMPEATLTREELESDSAASKLEPAPASAPTSQATTTETEPKLDTGQRRLLSQPERQQEEACICGHARPIHLHDGKQQLYCMQCTKEGKAVKCDLQVIGR